jgi:hypothetical protein
MGKNLAFQNVPLLSNLDKAFIEGIALSGGTSKSLVTNLFYIFGLIKIYSQKKLYFYWIFTINILFKFLIERENNI